MRLHILALFSLLLLAINTTLGSLVTPENWAQIARENNYPPPPKPPAKFRCKAEIKDYLTRVHHYYAVLGRPRFGRRRRRGLDETQPFSSPFSVQLLMDMIDRDRDGLASRDELLEFFRIEKSDDVYSAFSTDNSFINKLNRLLSN